MYVLPQFEGLLEETQVEFIKEVLDLEFVKNSEEFLNNSKELINFTSEYFGIDKGKFQSK
jgi:hypothetical protein